MSLVCAISNDVPQLPVISQKTGYVYEKRLLEKYIETYKTDPITGENASMDDYTIIQGAFYLKPKPPAITSIPAMLKAQHDEWDASMLYTFYQKQQMQTLKQELSHSLYQHDASLRVVSRLSKEVTAAREALSSLKPHASIGVAAAPQHTITSVTNPQPAIKVNQPSATREEMEIEEKPTIQIQTATGMSEEIESLMITCSKSLTSERKKKMKQLPEDLVKSGEMENYVLKETKTGIHSINTPGILALDISKRDSTKIITGGNDKNAVVYNTSSSEIISVLKGHTQKVTSVIYHPTEDIGITSSDDCSIRVWAINSGDCDQIINAHTSSVTGLSLHATNKYVVSCSDDGHWAFSDIESGSVVLRTESKNKRTNSLNKFTCMKSHPDGLICANGTEGGEVIIWHLKDNKEVTMLQHSQSASITSLAFSENGFYLATGASDGIVKLWDLRKVKEFKSFSPNESESSSTPYQIQDLEFDSTGTYLGIAGTDVRVFLSKQWNKVVKFNEHTGLSTGIRFAQNCTSILSCGVDRSVKIYGMV